MKLFDHQKQSTKFLEKHERVCDFSDAGTGKTAVHIVAYAAHRASGGGCALILAPKSLLDSVWADEFKVFAPKITTSVCYALKREESFAKDVDVYITNIDATNWLAKQKKSFFDRFDTLIIDESTFYKHYSSARSKALKKIVKYFKIRRILTGTATENGILDVWNQARIVDDGERLGNTYFGFRAATCTPKQVGPKANHLKWTDMEGIESVVAGLLADITIRHNFEDCTDIPKKHEYTIGFELSKKHMQQYKEFEAESYIDLKREGVVSAVNAAVRYGKLLQIASGAVYSLPGTATKEEILDAVPHIVLDGSRYDLILDMIKARPHTVLMYNWNHQRAEIESRLKAANISYAVIEGEKNKIAETVKEFQNGWYKVILGNPLRAAHGLTLTKAATLIFASPPLRAGLYIQGLKRIYRISQKNKSEIITVVGKGTLDEAVAANNRHLNSKMFDLLSYLEGKK